MPKNGFPGLYNYIDDLVFSGLPSNIHLANKCFAGPIGRPRSRYLSQESGPL